MEVRPTDRVTQDGSRLHRVYLGNTLIAHLAEKDGVFGSPAGPTTDARAAAGWVLGRRAVELALAEKNLARRARPQERNDTCSP
jgi:hypothetical protein